MDEACVGNTANSSDSHSCAQPGNVANSPESQPGSDVPLHNLGEYPGRQSNFSLLSLVLGLVQLVSSVFTASRLAFAKYWIAFSMYSTMLCFSTCAGMILTLRFFKTCTNESSAFTRYAIQHSSFLSVVTIASVGSLPALQVITSNLPMWLPLQLGVRTRAPINDDLLLDLRSLMLYSVLLENIPQLLVLLWIHTSGVDTQAVWFVNFTIGTHVLDCLYLGSFGCISALLQGGRRSTPICTKRRGIAVAMAAIACFAVPCVCFIVLTPAATHNHGPDCDCNSKDYLCGAIFDLGNRVLDCNGGGPPNAPTPEACAFVPYNEDGPVMQFKYYPDKKQLYLCDRSGNCNFGSCMAGGWPGAQVRLEQCWDNVNTVDWAWDGTFGQFSAHYPSKSHPPHWFQFNKWGGQWIRLTDDNLPQIASWPHCKTRPASPPSPTPVPTPRPTPVPPPLGL